MTFFSVLYCTFDLKMSFVLSQARMKCSLMGLLDIYGFEIFQVNW
jgi:myosin heavy subunit